jgi:hypothetical protein
MPCPKAGCCGAGTLCCPGGAFGTCAYPCHEDTASFIASSRGRGLQPGLSLRNRLGRLIRRDHQRRLGGGNGSWIDLRGHILRIVIRGIRDRQLDWLRNRIGCRHLNRPRNRHWRRSRSGDRHRNQQRRNNDWRLGRCRCRM